MAERETPKRDPGTITVTEDGPYRVEGDVPLRHVRIEYSEYGEPIEWVDGPEFEAPEPYELCRCGRSSHKPFCDRSHELVDFDGTETADRGPSESRRVAYAGEGLVVTDDASLCSHAGFCTTRLTSVWQMMEETDDPEIRERVMAMVSRCPSGRLQYALDEAGPAVEQDLEPMIGVEADGPLVVRGRVRIVSEDGTAWEVRNRVTLCRCGESANKPFCDGTHQTIGFRDPGLPAEVEPAEAEGR